MPSTLTPGCPAAIGQDGQDTPIPLEPPGLADPPGPPGLPASSGPWLITVPAGWPPYDCETHGAACPAAAAAAAARAGADRDQAANGAVIADAVGHAGTGQPS